MTHPKQIGRSRPRRWAPGLAVLLGLAWGGPAAAQPEGIRLFVYQLDFPEEMDADRRAILTSLLNEALDARPELAVLGRDDLQVLVKGDVDLGNLVGCEDETCEKVFEDIGRVRLFLAVTVAQGPEGDLVALRVFDRRDRAVVFRESFLLGDELDETREILARAAQQLVEQVAQLPGTNVTLAPAPERAALAPLGWVGVVGAASGALCLAVGSIVGGAAASKAADVEVLDNGTYLTQVQAAEARDLGWAANGLWITGAALAAMGTVLIILGREPTTDLDVAAGPDGVGAVIRF